VAGRAGTAVGVAVDELQAAALRRRKETRIIGKWVMFFIRFLLLNAVQTCTRVVFPPSLKY
jgi:hypothetical protein